MLKANSNGKRHASQQSLNGAVKSICDIMRRSNCAGALQYVPELTWMLFLRILDELEEAWKAVEREARESQAKGDSIENAAYDLKAVNPNRVTEEDKRTPMQLLDFIAVKGREADAAIGKLRQLVRVAQ